ncbi:MULTISPECIES: hypothetical protein [Fischerella]|uniref:hypothetical protein n=1 Tax=Fischerella TaxID=1190 RepID=UPI0002EAB4A0|nr:MULTISPECIES: hypothetical protein [Fischerella]MBD2434514.1 hypothetical protein [Fischerella sp. FACHB-380]
MLNFYTDLQASKALLQKLANNIPGVINKLRVSKNGDVSMPRVCNYTTKVKQFWILSLK